MSLGDMTIGLGCARTYNCPMQYLATTIVAGVFFFGVDADDMERESADEIGEAYSLADAWDEQWLRIFDRSGRPDPDGPMLQRFSNRLHRRYQFDVTVPDFPLSTEPMWAGQRDGARLWVQSTSERELLNRWQLRREIDTWEDGFVFFQYDRRQGRLADSHVVRFDVGHRDVGTEGLDLAVRFHPKFDKEDIDVELRADYAIDGIGDAAMSVGFLDPFINPAYALIRSRGHTPSEEIRQVDVPLVVDASLRTERFLRLRGELYGGMVVPQTRRHRFADEPEDDHLRHRRAVLGAALLEWDVPRVPVHTGVALQGVDAEMEWEFLERPDDDRIVGETTTSQRLFAVAQPLETLRLEGSVLRTTRPQHETGPLVPDDGLREDREWLFTLRTFWTPHDVVGADVMLLRMHRDAHGPPTQPVAGTFNRLVTRAMLRVGDDVWTSFGVGWTPDAGTSIYDGGGMTLIYAPR